MTQKESKYESGNLAKYSASLNIPGLIFRRFQNEEDFSHYANIVNACRLIDGISPQPVTGAAIAQTIKNRSNFDLSKDLIFVEISQKVIGYGWFTWGVQANGKRIYFSVGLLLPEWRRKKIGTAILHRNETRLREIAHEHPADVPKYHQCWVFDGQFGLARMLEKAGYAQARSYVEMQRPIHKPIPDAPWPEGLEIRPVTSEHYHIVWDAGEEACQDQWEYSPSTENNYQRFLSSSDFCPALWQIAWDGEEVAGMILNFVRDAENQAHNRKRGYTERIRVRRPWRRRGLATALLVESIEMLKEMGMEETYLQVDANNPTGALSLYKNLGYEVVKTQSIYRKKMI